MNLYRAKPLFSQCKPLIISGPSGVGKGSLVQRLLTDYEQFQYSVSLTTRNPRQGEIDGVHYQFISQQRFNDEISKNSFLEYCEVHGNLYGTHKEQVTNIITCNKIPIIEIDVQGAEKINLQLKNQCHNIFIMPPSIEALRERLTKRGTEAEEIINKRIRNAEKEIERATSLQFYHFLINNQFDICYSELKHYVKEKYRLNQPKQQS